MADLKFEGPIAGDPFLMLGGFDLAASGYVGEEFFASGVAQSYQLAGGLPEDGKASAEPDASAEFITRIVVRRPSEARHFGGTVVVEWLNVSGGLDAAPDWLFMHRHWMREGVTWIGVSVQKAGIDGGGLVPGMPLKEADGPRYEKLSHPGDAFAFDIFTQIGEALRVPGSGPLGALEAERVIGLGESQSAGFLVTYVNAVDPLARCYDGFMIHGRPGTAAPIDGTYLSRAANDGELANVSRVFTEGHRIRADVRVPVFTVQSETDVISLGSARSRQPDSENFRLWEIAGAAHFDTYGLLGSLADDGSLETRELAERIAPTDTPYGMQANSFVNSGPQQHYILNAAFSHLERQVRDGSPPPSAPWLETLADDARDLARDELGIARGGIRTPWVDAPSAVLSGIGQGGEGFMFLFGKTDPLEAEALQKLYPDGAEEHRLRFNTAADAALDAGFLLEADAEEIRELAAVGRQPSGWQED